MSSIQRIAANITSSAASCCSSKGVYYGTGVLNFAVNKLDNKLIDEFQSNPVNVKKANDIADILLKKLDLEKKGVKIYNITEKNIDSFKACSKLDAQSLEKVAFGQDAFYTIKPINLMNGQAIEANSIIINREKSAVSLLHELGHADNYNSSPVLKLFSIISLCTPSILKKMPFVAALTKKNVAKEGQKLTNLQKIENTVHNSIPAATGVLSLPQIIDEGVASCKAVKWAKEYGDDKFAKELSKGYLTAYLTYVTEIFSNITATKFAKSSKDKMMQKIEDKFIG